MTCIAGIVDAEVGGDAIEPGAEAGLGAVGLAGAIDAEEDLLGKLFGDSLVVNHAVHEMDDRLAVLLDEEVEAGHVAGAELEHDGRVVHLGELTGGMVDLGSLEVFEKARTDCQSSHTVHNPIFVGWLRL